MLLHQLLLWRSYLPDQRAKEQGQAMLPSTSFTAPTLSLTSGRLKLKIIISKFFQYSRVVYDLNSDYAGFFTAISEEMLKRTYRSKAEL